jgi:general secretion pathway protein E
MEKCMEMFAAAGNLLAVTGATSSPPLLPFSVARLAALILWFNVCLYVVHYIQYSPLVPRNQRTIASIISLFLGPLVFLAALIIYFGTIIIKGLSQTAQQHGITERLQEAITGLRTSSLRRPKSDFSIKLLDTAGTELRELYTHGKSKKHDSHILQLSEEIIADALVERASDILIDPKDEFTFTIRYRVDGVLRTVKRLEGDVCKAVINSIKAVAKMDIAEKRRPQDGSFIAKTSDGTVSFRAASAGVHNGEKLSIRVLNQNAGMFTLSSIGLMEKQQTVVSGAVGKPNGMILICGPTGSGKTTTLYAMLNKIDLFTRNVITVEDPIEYVLPNASQIEVNPKADITFAKALRSILRQDPDVITVGEIRDEETAAIALQAAQTGHLVLATMHCNSNAAALVRLLDLGVSSVLMASGLNVAISQRLLRVLCKHCKKPAKLARSQISDFEKRKINYANIYEAKGCPHCNGTGYYGRTAIFDILVFDNALKSEIMNNQLFLADLKKEGDRRGKSNLQKEGLRKVVTGVTTLEELKRVVG